MTSDRVGALKALLTQAEVAHAEYEKRELKGVYDQDWPRWYAQYAVDHGIGDVLGRRIAADELAGFLQSCWDEIQRADPKPTEPWSAYMARRIAAEL